MEKHLYGQILYYYFPKQNKEVFLTLDFKQKKEIRLNISKAWMKIINYKFQSVEEWINEHLTKLKRIQKRELTITVSNVKDIGLFICSGK